MRISDRAANIAAGGLVAALLVSVSDGQVLPGRANKVTPATPPAAVPVAGETPGQARREARQEARETRDDLRDAGGPRAEGRREAREVRRDTRQLLQANRAADYGVWFNTLGNQGLVIDDITNNGVFATAGFRSGDQIVSINGQRVANEAQFVQLLTAPGAQTIEIVVIRNGQQQTLVLQPATLNQGVVSYDPFYQYGIVVDDRTPDRIVVQRVYPRTAAYYAGLRAGDVITTFGGQQITSIDAFSRSLAQADAAFNLGIARGGQMRNIQLDAADISGSSSMRTALRPNLDADDDRRDGTRRDLDSRRDARGEAEGRPGDRNPNLPPPGASQPNSPVAAPPADAPRNAPPGQVNPPQPTNRGDAVPRPGAGATAPPAGAKPGAGTTIPPAGPKAGVKSEGKAVIPR